MKNIIKRIVKEYTYEDIMSLMRGKRNDVKTLGIITAWYPQNTEVDQKTNDWNQAHLKKELRQRGYNFIDISGLYYRSEDSILVINISKSDLIELASPEYFNQESVIFGRKLGRKFIFEYIESGITTQMRDVLLGKEHEDLVNADNLYSLIKNKKFKIPFFVDGKFQYSEKDYKKDLFKSKGLYDTGKIKEYYNRIIEKMLKTNYNKYSYEEFKPIVDQVIYKMSRASRDKEYYRLMDLGMSDENISLIFNS